MNRRVLSYLSATLLALIAVIGLGATVLAHHWTETQTTSGLHGTQGNLMTVDCNSGPSPGLLEPNSNKSTSPVIRPILPIMFTTVAGRKTEAARPLHSRPLRLAHPHLVAQRPLATRSQEAGVRVRSTLPHPG